MNPSLKIDRKSGMWLWHCFGCDAGGTVIDFVMKMEGVSFTEAYRKLAGNDGDRPVKKSAPPKKELSTAKLQKLLGRVVAFYRRSFVKDRRGEKYLSQKRGITQAGLFEAFGVGFSNGTLLEAIPQKGDIVEGLLRIPVA